MKQPSFVSPPAHCHAASVVCFAYKFVSFTNISTSSVKYNLNTWYWKGELSGLNCSPQLLAMLHRAALVPLHPDPTLLLVTLSAILLSLFRFIVTCIIHKKNHFQHVSNQISLLHHAAHCLQANIKQLLAPLSPSLYHLHPHLPMNHRKKSIIQTIFYTCIFKIILTL